MDVILLERIEKLGQMGEVVRVKAGFARNYLLPRKKAMRATKDNLAYFDKQRAQLEATNLARRSEAEMVAGRMRDVRIVVIRQAGDTGQLYGSVTARDISDGVTAAGYTVARHQIAIDRPIKSLGLFEVRLVLHPEVQVTVGVNVARSPEEAALQAERGGMVTADMLEAEEEAAEAAEAAARAAAEAAAAEAEAEP